MKSSWNRGSSVPPKKRFMVRTRGQLASAQRMERTVSASEAGVLTLVEPILTPVWAYFVADEVPQVWTFVGGAIVLLALAYRYWPASQTDNPAQTGTSAAGDVESSGATNPPT